MEAINEKQIKAPAAGLHDHADGTLGGASAADRSALDFTFSKTDVPGAQETGPAGINNAGVIVGWYMDSYENVHGYILNGKKLTKLDDPKGEGTTFANGLNPNGPVWVVGSYTSSETGKSVGFLYKVSTRTSLVRMEPCNQQPVR